MSGVERISSGIEKSRRENYLENPTCGQERLEAAPEHTVAVATTTTAMGIRTAVLIQMIDTFFDLRINHAWAKPGKADYKESGCLMGGIDDTRKKYIQVPQSSKQLQRPWLHSRFP